jgi:hypothetical protein
MVKAEALPGCQRQTNRSRLDIEYENPIRQAGLRDTACVQRPMICVAQSDHP